MQTVNSKDGTTIAFDRVGNGPGLILVGGAFQFRAFDQSTARLAGMLADRLTVIHYDRRGRGDSSNTLPFSISREVEDIEALVDTVGGTASLFGMSSGGSLAMEAAIALSRKIKRFAVYEPPFNDEADSRQRWREYRRNLSLALSEDRRDDAVELFMTQVGMPQEAIAGMRQSPAWPMLEAVAPTLAYDAAVMGEEAAVPVEQAVKIHIPTLILTGGASYPFMYTAARTLAATIPDAQHRVLDGQTHDVAPEVLAPVLMEFFTT